MPPDRSDAERTLRAATPSRSTPHELAALAAADDRPRPPSWQLSPWAVATYLLGGTLADGTEITPKYVGQRRLIEIAVATLATDRALLLLGVPGTAKSWVSEHLAAADQRRLDPARAGHRRHDRGGASATAGTTPGCWPRGRRATPLVPSPVMRAMETGALVRVEELTRIPADVQDALITSCPRRRCPIPELDTEVQARKGFNVIATANDRDQGVNELSAALKRRFNTVVLPLPDDARGGGRDRPPARGRSSAPPSSCRPSCEALGEIRAGRHRLPRAARRA